MMYSDYLVRFANSLGRPVVTDRAGLRRHGFNAACMSAPGGPIVVSGSLDDYRGSPAVANFTLAHEIGHAIDFADRTRMSRYIGDVWPRVRRREATEADRQFLYSQEVLADQYGGWVLRQHGLVSDLAEYFASREHSLSVYRKLYFEQGWTKPELAGGQRCAEKCVLCGDRP